MIFRRLGNILDPIHDTLDARVWDDEGSPSPKLKPEHLKWITDEIHTFAKQLAPDPERWLRLVLTGSLTTYQYSDQSDCDVSLFVDPHVLPEWSRGQLIGLAVGHLDGRKLPGTPFEMQGFVVPKNISPVDLYQPGLRSGYDLQTNSWIIPPDRSRVHDVEREYNVDYIYALESADKMERLLRYDRDRAVMFWHQIHKRRQRDQRKGKGDFSQANIVYKMLANRGLFPDISEASGEYIARTGAYEPWRDDPVVQYPRDLGRQQFNKNRIPILYTNDGWAVGHPGMFHGPLYDYVDRNSPKGYIMSGGMRQGEWGLFHGQGDPHPDHVEPMNQWIRNNLQVEPRHMSQADIEAQWESS